MLAPTELGRLCPILMFLLRPTAHPSRFLSRLYRSPHTHTHHIRCSTLPVLHLTSHGTSHIFLRQFQVFLQSILPFTRHPRNARVVLHLNGSALSYLRHPLPSNDFTEASQTRSQHVAHRRHICSHFLRMQTLPRQKMFGHVAHRQATITSSCTFASSLRDSC